MQMWHANDSAALEAQVGVAFPKGSRGAGDPWGALTIRGGRRRVGSSWAPCRRLDWLVPKATTAHLSPSSAFREPPQPAQGPWVPPSLSLKH